MFLVGWSNKNGVNSVATRYDEKYLKRVISGHYLNSSTLFQRVFVLVKND